MGLFSFFKKNSKKEKQDKNEILLGMVLLKEPNSMKIKPVIEELRDKWKLKVNDKDSGDETSVLIIDNYQIAIGNMPIPIPGNEIEETASFNYYWENGKTESSEHKGHIIVSITNCGKNPIKENLLFNKIISSILNNSKSLGVYIGGRTLLLSKDFYQGNVEDISEENLPINNLIYFGIRSEHNKNSIYTYGLKDFRKQEMEIIESKHSLEDLLGMMYNLTSYVLENDVILKDGETIGMSETQKLKIKQSKGKNLEGQTLKIDY
ncbi:DUF4261 domain-containing protein [Lacihabitans soyangensis]|uniref:DUF4261 domain-containing protein n=2 Tax=Lacihabitans soyangensis TaxID=869394 RepID=A0AAE3H3B6_9BACT|nr:DUF4261 domain-containing protein [Lacihabitans soyangensis]